MKRMMLLALAFTFVVSTGCAAIKAGIAAQKVENEMVADYQFKMGADAAHASVLELFASQGFEVDETQSAVYATDRQDDRVTKYTATIRTIDENTSDIKIFFTERERNSNTGKWSENNGDAFNMKRQLIDRVDPEYASQIDEAKEAAKVQSKLENS